METVPSEKLSRPVVAGASKEIAQATTPRLRDDVIEELRTYTLALEARKGVEARYLPSAGAPVTGGKKCADAGQVTPGNRSAEGSGQKPRPLVGSARFQVALPATALEQTFGRGKVVYGEPGNLAVILQGEEGAGALVGEKLLGYPSGRAEIYRLNARLESPVRSNKQRAPARGVACPRLAVAKQPRKVLSINERELAAPRNYSTLRIEEYELVDAKPRGQSAGELAGLCGDLEEAHGRRAERPPDASHHVLGGLSCYAAQAQSPHSGGSYPPEPPGREEPATREHHGAATPGP